MVSGKTSFTRIFLNLFFDGLHEHVPSKPYVTRFPLLYEVEVTYVDRGARSIFAKSGRKYADSAFIRLNLL